MRFNQDFIDKVRESTNIVDIISSRTQLRRAGTHRLVGLCPFHSEKTPSFSVSEDKQMYYCFGCKAAGNVYTFVQQAQGLTFPEAVEYLAQKAGLPIPKEAYDKPPASGVSSDQKRDQQKLLFRVNQFAARFYQNQLQQLPESHPVKLYLAKRGLRPETVAHFGLGYAPDEWETLTHTLTRKGVPLAVAEQLGLIRARGQGKSGHYDIFRHRLMFPIVSPTEQVIGFGGRILDEGQPKYLNSPESEIFHKGRVFYGLNESAKHIRVEDRVIVVEGYMDYLALVQAGIHPVVATLGTALTPEHARTLKRYTKNVIVLFDGDAAGQDAAARSLPLLLAADLVPRGLVLEDKLDPDDYLQKYGAQALEAKLVQAPELFMILLDHEVKGFRGSAGEKVALLDRLSPVLESCSDRRLKELYIQEVADRLQADPAWVTKALRSPATPAAAARVGEATAKSPVQSSASEPEIPPLLGSAQPEQRKIEVRRAPQAELYLLNVALMKEKYFQRVIESGVVEELSHEGVRQVFSRARELYRQMPSKFDSLTALLVTEVEPPEVVSLHLSRPLSELHGEGADKLIADCTKKIRQSHLRNRSKQIAANLRGQDAQEQMQKLEQIMNIHRSRHSLNKDS